MSQYARYLLLRLVPRDEHSITTQSAHTHHHCGMWVGEMSGAQTVKTGQAVQTGPDEAHVKQPGPNTAELDGFGMLAQTPRHPKATMAITAVGLLQSQPKAEHRKPPDIIRDEGMPGQLESTPGSGMMTAAFTRHEGGGKRSNRRTWLCSHTH